ncbi:nSTAND1 domain-containing NTPase [Micromonospora sp. CPCC 206061]|uniref:nSTAND1 domain-containing NTPase n=1 Tax=Micromonospora sp. CPCC 206061 TaxID=3122410 RepID=UPI002FF157B2
MTRSRDAGVDVVVLTALGLEYDAVYPYLADPREHVDSDGTRYAVGVLRGGACRVALAVMGPGNVAAAALTGRAIEEFRPRALFLVGIAGGLVDDTRLGDVVVATHVYAYQGARAEPGGTRVRPKGWPLAHRLEQIARGVARTGDWTASLGGGGGGARVHFKPLVSGDVVLDTHTGPIAETIFQNFSDAIAIDMESVGVAEAALRKDFYRAVTIRGVSDAAGGHKRRTDAHGWQPRAAVHAAAFAVTMAERVVRPVPAPPPARRAETGPCPYPGLAAFGEQDADLFFGRGELADELADLVTRRRFVAVTGPSGSGKSSLLHAGLKPRLRPHGWAIAAFRPLAGVPAAKALAAGLLPLLHPEGTDTSPRRAAMAGMIADGRLPDLVGTVLAETGAARLLVCVDQFEELDEGAAEDLAGLLARLATGALPVHVVLTLRTEALDLAAGRLGLGELARTSVFLLTPMRPDQLRAAIEAPVGPTGVTFQEGLVDRIVAAGGASASLPLIQFALTRLWEEQDGPLLTHAVYDGFGGFEGALAGYAERVWATDLDPDERAAARRLLPQLTRPIGADGVVRRTARAGALDPGLRPVARRLAATRLVVESVDAGGEPAYDLAHAALATHWQRLAGWLAEERDFRAWQEDLRESQQRGEPLRGQRLSEARRWLREHPQDITGEERRFIAGSLHRHRRRTAAWRGAAALIAILALLTSTLTVILTKRGGELAEQVRQNAAHALVTDAGEVAPNKPDTAALMTVAAYRANSDPTVLAHLAGQYQRYRSTDRLLPSDVTYLRQVRVSTDGQVIAAVGTGGGVLWRLNEQPATPVYLDSGLTGIALSPDGQRVAGIDGSRRVAVWGQDGARVALGEFGNLLTGIPSLRFAPDGRRLLAVQPRVGLKAWDVEGRAVTLPADAIDQVRDAERVQAWFGPSGDDLVVAVNGTLTVWDLSTNEDARMTGAGANGAAVSSDGRTAYTCAGTTLTAWNLVTRKKTSLPAPGARCPDLSDYALDESGSVIHGGVPTDHSGRFLVTGAPLEGRNQHLRVRASLMDTERRAMAYPVLPPNSGPVLAYDIAAVGDTVRVVSAAGSAIAVVDLAPADFAPLNRGLEPDFAAGPLLGPGQPVAATAASKPPALSIWDTDTGQRGTTVAAGKNETLVRFAADDRLLTRVAPNNLVVRDVPSLGVVGRRLPLHTEPEVVANGLFYGLCAADTPDPDIVAVLFAGYASRIDLRSGTLVDRIRLWRDRTELPTFAGTNSCSLRPRHDQLAFDNSRTVEVWSLTDKAWVASFPLDRPAEIVDVRFSTDGSHLAVLGADGALDVWDVDQRLRVIEALTVLPAGLPYHSIVHFPTRDRIIVKIGGGLRIWDLARDSIMAEIDIDSLNVRPVLSADGDTLLIWMRSAGLMRMPLEPERWAEHLCRAIGRDLTAAERRTLPPGTPGTPACPH